MAALSTGDARGAQAGPTGHTVLTYGSIYENLCSSRETTLVRIRVRAAAAPADVNPPDLGQVGAQVVPRRKERGGGNPVV